MIVGDEIEITRSLRVDESKRGRERLMANPYDAANQKAIHVKSNRRITWLDVDGEAFIGHAAAVINVQKVPSRHEAAELPRAVEARLLIGERRESIQ